MGDNFPWSAEAAAEAATEGKSTLVNFRQPSVVGGAAAESGAAATAGKSTLVNFQQVPVVRGGCLRVKVNPSSTFGGQRTSSSTAVDSRGDNFPWSGASADNGNTVSSAGKSTHVNFRGSTHVNFHSGGLEGG